MQNETGYNIGGSDDTGTLEVKCVAPSSRVTMWQVIRSGQLT